MCNEDCHARPIQTINPGFPVFLLSLALLALNVPRGDREPDPPARHTGWPLNGPLNDFFQQTIGGFSGNPLDLGSMLGTTLPYLGNFAGPVGSIFNALTTRGR